MSVQTALVAIKTAHNGLNTLVGTRFHPDKWEQGSALPAIVFQVVDRVERSYTFGVVPDILQYRVQVDGYAATAALRTALTVQMRSAFNRTRGTYGGETIIDIRIEGERESVEMLDQQSQARRISMDLLIDIQGS